MIQSRTDLKEYLEADRVQLGYKYMKPRIRDIVWRYEIYNNVNGGGVAQRSGEI